MSDHCSTCGQDLPPAAGRAWSFELPLVAPSQNTKGAVNRGMGRFRYATLRNQLQLLLANQRQRQCIPPAAGRRRVTITILHRGGHERDPDNLVGGHKVLVDAMVLAGLLRNDTAADVEAHYHQRPGPPGTLIRIEELELAKEVRHAR